MPGQQYNAAALARAQQQGLTHVQVRGLDYRDMASLAGVAIQPNGNSAEDFFYENIRGAVANELRAAAISTAQHSARVDMLEAIRAHWGEATLETDPDGHYIVDLHGGELPGLEINP